MRIIDPVNNKLGLGNNPSRDTIGIVFKTSEMYNNRPVLGLIIPKFMLGYSYSDGDQPEEKTYKINNSKCINDDEQYWDSSVKIKNYITVHPYLNQNQEMPIYTQGDKVIVTMIDDDIKTLAFLPYSISRLGQRKTDKLIMLIPGNPKENTELTEENSYMLRLDSTEDVQAITLQTSASNGEMCYHTIKLDSKNGLLTITDNKNLSVELDTQNDSITSKTSGSTIEQVGDQVNITCDTMNISADTKIYMKTDKLEIEAETIESSSSTMTIDSDKSEMNITSGQWNVDSEKHEGMSVSFKANTFHSDSPVNGFNGICIFPSFQIGNIPNPTVIPPPINGMSGPKGAMVLSTDPAGQPVALFPQLAACLAQIAASADAGSKSPTGTNAVVNWVQQGFSKKLLTI